MGRRGLGPATVAASSWSWASSASQRFGEAAQLSASPARVNVASCARRGERRGARDTSMLEAVLLRCCGGTPRWSGAVD